MAFVLTKPGGWAFGEIFTSPQAEDLDTKTANAIDGVGGGTYAPAVQIVIGGAGFACTGPSSFVSPTISGTLSVVNLTVGVNPGSDLVVNATSTFHAEVICQTDLTVGDDLTVTDDAIIGGSLVVSTSATVAQNASIGGDLVVGDDVTVGDDLTVTDDATINGDLVANGDTTLGSSSSDDVTINGRIQNPLAFEALGRVPLRVGTLTDSDQTLTVADGNVFRVPTTLSATRVKTLGTTNALDGDFMLFYSRPNAPLSNSMNINSPTSGQDDSSAFQAAESGRTVIYVFEGGEWYIALRISS